MNTTWKKVARSVGAATLVMTLAACSSSTGSGGGGYTGGSEEFPADIYPESKYGNLEGSLLWYDTSGGTVADAMNATYFADFQKLTGVTTSSEFTDGSTTKFLAGEQQGAVPWSLVQLTAPQYFQAEKDGLLEPLDPAVVPVDDVEAYQVTKYGIGAGLYGQIMIWNTDLFPESGEHPESISALLDTERFPGKRCFPQSIAGLAEQILLADGVPKESIYPLDMERAYKALDRIKDDILWWSSADVGVANIVNGECSMGVTYSGRAYAAVKENKPVAASWDGAFISFSMNSVPKGAPNPKAGQAMIAMWIEDHPANIKFVSQFPYPTAIKDLPASAYPAEAQEWLPLGKNTENAVQHDPAFYADKTQELDIEFERWLSS